MELSDAKRIVEALLFVTEQPVTLKMLHDVFEQQFDKDTLEKLCQELQDEYRLRSGALEVQEIAGGWQFATRTELGPWIRRLFKDRLTYRLSHSAMETLSIIAYKQPITRNEIEEIRGVEVTAVLDTIMERKLIRIAGRKETIGRPILFGTTPEFLKAFGLRRLEDLPAIESLVPPTTSEVAAAEAAAATVEGLPEGKTVVAESQATPEPVAVEAVVASSPEEESKEQF